MNKPVSIALLVIGIVLLILASLAGDSMSSFFSELFQGTPDARTLILLIGGLFATIVGIFGLVRGARAG